MDEVETLIKNRELIDDIDKDDVENPQLVVEYVNEIYAYLRQLEVKQEIRPNYLKSKKVEKTTYSKNKGSSNGRRYFFSRA